MIRKLCILLLLCVTVTNFGCARKSNDEVIIYTSLDQVFSEPILRDFERETGIKVKAIYDLEAAKTTGLVNRLIAEKNNPRCDVFWNSEFGRTIILKKKGVLDQYISPSAKDIPGKFKDRDGYWTGFAARARVLVYNKDLVSKEELPKSIFDLTDPKWKGQVALANPLFGTTAAHTASLFILLGDDKAKEYFSALKQNDVVIVDGNSTSRDRVADGILKIGFTDTDDVNVAIEEGKNVGMIFPDKDGIGTLFIPNTICLIKGAPNPENAKKLIDYILSRDVEKKLAFSQSLQIPVRSDIPRPEIISASKDFKPSAVSYDEIADKMESTGKILQEILLK